MQLPNRVVVEPLSGGVVMFDPDDPDAYLWADDDTAVDLSE